MCNAPLATPADSEICCEYLILYSINCIVLYCIVLFNKPESISSWLSRSISECDILPALLPKQVHRQLLCLPRQFLRRKFLPAYYLRLTTPLGSHLRHLFLLQDVIRKIILSTDGIRNRRLPISFLPDLQGILQVPRLQLYKLTLMTYNL